MLSGAWRFYHNGVRLATFVMGNCWVIVALILLPCPLIAPYMEVVK